MLKIRLARIGKKKKPTYRFIVSEAARDTYGKALEILGSYNPFSKVCDVKKDRILYWISQGAQASPTAHNLLVDQNVISGAKLKASKGGKKKNAPLDSAQGASSAAEMAEKSAEGNAETAEKPADKVAENTEVKVEEKKEEKAEEKTEKKPVAEVKDKAEVKPEEKPAENAETKVEEKPEEKPEAKPAEPAA